MVSFIQLVFFLLGFSTEILSITHRYRWWKGTLASYELDGLSSIVYGIRIALNLMNDAIRLGEDTKYRLQRPELNFPSPTPAKPFKTTTRPKAIPTTTTTKPLEDQISFRSIVEETVAESDLIFQPTGRSHEATGSQLFRISRGIDGRGSVTVYLRDDVVWMLDGSVWKPVGMSDLIARAKAS
jgi:tuftelin-interacting protein 11